MAELPINLNIGNVEQTLKCAALKRKPERMPDWTVRSVAADQVFGRYRLRFAARVPDLCGDARLVL